MKDLFLALSSGENFGWGICSKYLKRELPKLYKIQKLEDICGMKDYVSIEGTVFHALVSKNFEPLFAARGLKNVGYTFFEEELTAESLENSKNYNLILGGSKWNEEKLRQLGINNAGTLIQGVDPEVFYPIKPKKNKDLFVIFSGGKFELRKSQDIVIKAVSILQAKYKDVVLINAWYNMWPQTMASMTKSRYIKFNPRGNGWEEYINNILSDNGIIMDNVITLGITPNEKMINIFSMTDVGLFPNRCEGGTNLVLMEYMACAKPVIASYTSGHRDVVNANNALPVRLLTPFKLVKDNKLFADWEEPSLDEIVANLEWAYFHRDELNNIGLRAGIDMQKFTWEESAKTLVDYLKINDLL